ncbi:MAG: hypothetical protein AAFQ24_05240 [Pseudomonadota bacterium]
MRWAMMGLTAIAGALSGTAYAGPEQSDVWIGLSDDVSGFLLDEDTGNLWMTGPCLKSLEPAQQSGSSWASRTIELVSIGRGYTQLDQHFVLDLSDGAAQIVVTSAGRGGAQAFSARIDRDCSTGGLCARLIQTQQACQD